MIAHERLELSSFTLNGSNINNTRAKRLKRLNCTEYAIECEY